MIDEEEKDILLFLKNNMKYSSCYKPTQIYSSMEPRLTNEDKVVTLCRILCSKKLIDAETETSNDSSHRNTCYSISKLGLDELNPNTRDKKIYKMIVVGTLSAIIAAIASVIGIFTR